MAGRQASRDAISREQWASHIAAQQAASAAQPAGPATSTRGTRRSRTPITVGRIVSAALEVTQAGGFEALTMRTVATALDTGPASLYAHVRNKSELSDLLIAELCSRVELPTPDRSCWQEQFLNVCSQLRDQFLRYPGVARAALAVVPNDLETLRVGETMLGILLASGAPAQDATWASDSAFLYVTAYCLEAATAQQQSLDADGNPIDRAEIAKRLRMLPAQQFPNMVAHARELTAGEGHERFDFTLKLMMRGLV